MLILVSACTPGRANIRENGNKAKLQEIDEVDFEDENFDPESNDNGPSVAVNGGKSNIDEGFISNDEPYNNSNNSNYYQKGIASWYGREYHGNKTASGETFNMFKYTAAHRTLPYGSIVEVKNFDNGKKVTVTINDRGPYKGNRIIDLSYASAKKIRMIGGGKARVGLIVVRKGYKNRINKHNIEAVSDDYAGEESSSGRYSLQLGAFYSKRNANKLKKQVQNLLESDVNIVFDGEMYKVRVEGINNKQQVGQYRRLLREEEIPSYLIDKNKIQE